MLIIYETLLVSSMVFGEVYIDDILGCFSLIWSCNKNESSKIVKDFTFADIFILPVLKHVY